MPNPHVKYHCRRMQRGINPAETMDGPLPRNPKPAQIVAYEVTRLRRIQYGHLKLEDLPFGAWRKIPIEDVRKALRL
jgi:hypothetical protein